MESEFRNCKIAIVGLGLIGGSLAKGLKEKTKASVYGYDLDKQVLSAALKDKSIDCVLTVENDLSEMDITFVCLFPNQTVEFIKSNKEKFKENSLVLDFAGVKQTIIDEIEKIETKQFYFLGTHPMAGKEQVGYSHSEANLFDKASMILVPLSDTPEHILQKVGTLSTLLGFQRVTVTTAEHHDQVIALTSQLCHVLSSAFVQSPTANEFAGFSAGSFRDLSRVAKLNPTMWAQLFFANKEALLKEMNIFLNTLNSYKEALEQNDYETMHQLLSKGTKIKERLNSENN